MTLPHPLSPPTPPAQPSTQRALRRELRAKRRAMGRSSQRLHARQAAARLMRLPGIARARRIAVYVATDGEIDPNPIRARLAHPSRRWYLPRILSLNPPRLAFYPAHSARHPRPNGFGIPEPAARRQPPIKLAALDLVLVPLVGFDPDCQRLGMGLGFYDRCFGTIRSRSHWRRRPRLVGLAHECQRLDKIDTHPWDVTLDAVLTERRLYRCG